MSAGGVALATVAAFAMAGGGGVGGGVGSTGGSAVRVKIDGGKSAAKSGKRTEAWRRMGLRQLRGRADNALDCVVNSYGQVQEFFVRSPCRSLDRMLFVLQDGDGKIVLSVSWVRMAGIGTAERLQDLADTDGTGNVSPLPLAEAAGVRFTGRYYDSHRKGAVVTIAEAEPLSGSPDPLFMDGVAEVASLLPAP